MLTRSLLQASQDVLAFGAMQVAKTANFSSAMSHPALQQDNRCHDKGVEVYHVEKSDLNDDRTHSDASDKGIEIYRLRTVDEDDDSKEADKQEAEHAPHNNATGVEVFSVRIPQLSNRHCTFSALQSVETVLPIREVGIAMNARVHPHVMSFAPSKCVCAHCQIAERLEIAQPRGCLASL